MKLYDKLPVIALGVLVVMIVFAGPLVRVTRSLHTDPNIVGVFIGVVAGACMVLLVFRRHLAALFAFARRRLEQLEDAGIDELAPQNYLALPPARHVTDTSPWNAQDSDLDNAQHWGAHTRESAQEDAHGEPVLPLSATCPLPFSSAFHHTLIYEQPGAGRRDRSVAARLYLECFGATSSIPLLAITRNPSYASVLPHLANGWLAGSPQAREERLSVLARYGSQVPELAEHYASIDTSNARSFARKAIAYGAQVVVDLSTYADDPGQAARVLWRLLVGAQESEQPCLIMLLEADSWLSDEPYRMVSNDSSTQAQLNAQIQTCVSQLMESRHAVLYLVTPTLVLLDELLVNRCALWLLNREPDNARDAAVLTYQTGLSREGLRCLRDHAILADTGSQTAMELALYPHRSAHEEPSRQPSTSGLPPDLSQVAADEEPDRLGK